MRWFYVVSVLAVLAGNVQSREETLIPAEMVLIPAGPFLMGSNKTDTSGQAQEYGTIKPWYADEHPQHSVNLPAYYIDKYEVTNAQYRDFIRANNYWVPISWNDNGYLLPQYLLNMADLPTLRRVARDVLHIDRDTSKMDRKDLFTAIVKEQAKRDRLPVTEVNWTNANDYCHWVGKRLPSEAEWEKAARGSDGREYPWGNEWDPQRANTGEGRDWEFGVAPVGSYPQGVSPYGIYDMAGNVMEWVGDWYRPYPGNHYQSSAYGVVYKVVRGGGWGGLGHYTIAQFYRTAYRFYLKPDSAFTDLGFRCAKDVR